MPGSATPKTSLADALGFTTNANIQTPTTDPNSFQYGGQAGGATARGNTLANLGAAGANYGNYAQNEYSGAQQNALNMMQQQAQGNDNGVAEGQLKQGQANAAQEAFSQAASARGGGSSLAAAQQQAMQGNAAGQAGVNAQAAQMRAQLMNQGVQNYGAYAQGLSAQQNQANQFNAQLQQGYQGQINDVNAQQLAAQEAQQQLNSQNQLAAQQQALQEGEFNAQQSQSATGGLLGAVGGAAGAIAGAFSDENAKTNILDQSGSRFSGNAGMGISGQMPGMGAGSMGIGQAQLANRDAHTANFGQMGAGQQVWFNQANAKPWSPESAAAQSNANKFFFTSDARAKQNAHDEGYYRGLADQAKSLQESLGGYRDNFAPLDPSRETAVDWARAHRDDELPRPDQPTDNKVDQFLDASKPVSWDSYTPDAIAMGARPGEHIGTLTRHLKNAPNGQALVNKPSPETGGYETVDIPTATSSTLAGVGRLNERDKDNRARIDALESKVAAKEAGPAGPVREARLAPEEHGIYSAYDNNTKLTSDEKSKKVWTHQDESLTHTRGEPHIEGTEAPGKWTGVDKMLVTPARRNAAGSLTSDERSKEATAPESEHVRPERPEPRPVSADEYPSNLRPIPDEGSPDVIAGAGKRSNYGPNIDPRDPRYSRSDADLIDSARNNQYVRTKQEDAWDAYYAAHPKEMDPRKFGYSSMEDYLQTHDNPTLAQSQKTPGQGPTVAPSKDEGPSGKDYARIASDVLNKAGDTMSHGGQLAPTEDMLAYRPIARGPESTWREYGVVSDERAKAAVYEQGMRDGILKSTGGNVTHPPQPDQQPPPQPAPAPGASAMQPRAPQPPSQADVRARESMHLADPSYKVPSVQTPEQHEAIMKAIGFEEAHPEVGTAELQRHIDAIMAADPQVVRDYASGMRRSDAIPQATPRDENLGSWQPAVDRKTNLIDALSAEEAREPMPRAKKSYARR